MSAHPNDEEEPLEQIDGWSLWPVIDGVHLATRDRPLNDCEVRTLTMTRSLYATTRDRLLAKIAKQNQMAAGLAEDARARHG